MLGTFEADLRLAIRRIRRSPGLTAAIVVTMALGLGAATAILTVTEATLVDALPYPTPERLVEIHEQRLDVGEQTPTAYATLEDWRRRTSTYANLEGYDGANFIVGSSDGARMVRGAEITTGLFRALGVRILAGRDFASDEGRPGNTDVAIVTDRFARAFALGVSQHATVVVNGVAKRVVGILPSAPHVGLLQEADVFTPLTLDDARRTDHTLRTVTVVGRLKPRVPIENARRDLASAMSRLEHDYPDAVKGRTAKVTPLRDAVLGDVQPLVRSLLIAVGLLLLIMTANLGLLTLSRYLERTPELAVRQALGATRGRLLGQLLVETIVPSAIGAVAALLVGQTLTTELLAAIPAGVKIDMPYLLNTHLDFRVIGVVIVVAILLAMFFGVAPGILVTKRDVRTSGRRVTASRGDRRVRRVLVGAQIALTMVLLTAAGILLQSLDNLVGRDLGFQNASSIVSVRAPLTGPRYASDARQQQFYESVLASTRALPGVQSVGMIDEVPGGGSGSTTFQLSERPVAPAMQPRVMRRTVGGEYFATVAARLIAGRVFDARDRVGSPDVVVISRRLARLIEKDGPAIGRLLQFAITGQRVWQVIGVVDDIQVAAWDVETPPVVYFPHAQAADNRMTLVLRTSMPLSSIETAIRAIVRSLDPGVPVFGVATLEQQMKDSRAVFRRRFPLLLSGVFAATALLLTLVALYAVSIHEVVTRERELGVRVALGASPAALRGLIAGDALRLTSVGIAIGLILAILTTRSLQALVFEVSTRDVRVYSAAALTMAVSALAASIRPILRAGRVDPSVAMRSE